MKVLLTLVLLTLLSKNAFSNDTEGSLTISPLAENVFLHTSYKHYEKYGFLGSNGLIVVDEKKAYIIDTPWSKADTKKLVKWIKEKGYSIAGSVSTHSHEDRTSGIGFLNSLSIATYTSALTDKILKEKGEETAKYTFSDSEYSLDSGHIRVFYPGAGHTIDNLVVWLPKSKILFGGCLVKSLKSKNLGYTGEASINVWPNSIDTLISKYPGAKLVVPGHGSHGDSKLLEYTKKLAQTAIEKSHTKAESKGKYSH